MASHKNLGSLAIATIEELIQAAQICLTCKKSDGGCLGCPATLLLFCIVNALGNCLAGDAVTIDGRQQPITSGEPFRILNHQCFGLELSASQIKQLEKSCRNRLAHNAVIDLDSSLLPLSDDPPFVFKSGKVGIKVFSFYNLVAAAYSRSKGRIESWASGLQSI
jgi:hypothetical protein